MTAPGGTNCNITLAGNYIVSVLYAEVHKFSRVSCHACRCKLMASETTGICRLRTIYTYCTTMKLLTARKSLTIALPFSTISSGSSALRSAQHSIRQTQLTSRTLPFSTAAKLQARNSKRPKADLRISLSLSQSLSISTKLNVRPHSSDTLPSLSPSDTSAPPPFPPALPSSLDHSPCRPANNAP